MALTIWIPKRKVKKLKARAKRLKRTVSFLINEKI